MIVPNHNLFKSSEEMFEANISAAIYIGKERVVEMFIQATEKLNFPSIRFYSIGE